MIRLISVIFLTIFALLAFNSSQSYASDKKAYVAKGNEELYGTWVNEDYNSSSRWAIWEYKADGTWVVYGKTTDEISYGDGTYTITDKWTESNDDVCYKINWKEDYVAMSGYTLACISNSGSTMEAANSDSDYPIRIDQTKNSLQYYGVHYRK
jgi:hypothetical protein